MCHNKSYLIIYKIENKNLRIIVESPITKQKQQRAAVAFVNDTDFTISSSNTQQKI